MYLAFIKKTKGDDGNIAEPFDSTVRSLITEVHVLPLVAEGWQ